MKRKLSIIFIHFFIFTLLLTCSPLSSEVVWAEQNQPLLSIIIDDFGGFDQAGVETMLNIDAPLTCAVMPNLENSEKNSEQILNAGKEVILHMPMQAHVSLPLSWYGPNYINIGDSKEIVTQKIDKSLETVHGAKGINIHIGSGVCQDKTTLSNIYDCVLAKNMFFVDSRTHLNTKCEEVANEKNVIYLGRDEFLEPGGNRSQEGVQRHILEGIRIAKEKGHAIIIGHVGAHGGENTAKAIKDSIKAIQNAGVKLVTASELATFLNNKNSNTDNQ